MAWSLVLIALLAAASTRPWRCIAAGGPPWPWLALWALLPLLWSPAYWTGLPLPLMPAVSGAALLVLLAGWPLAVLALAAAALALACFDGLAAAAALQRLLWLGIAPATLSLLAGAAVRRLWPGHLGAYLLGRAFGGTLLASGLAAGLALALQGPPPGLPWQTSAAAAVLACFGEAAFTAAVVALLAGLRPQWLATCSQRVYGPHLAPLHRR